jgi:Family of unknown function (DUF6314)
VHNTRAPVEIEPLLAVWRRLQSARVVNLSVHDADTGAVQAQGTGSVTIDTTGGDGLVIRERGRWTGPHGVGAHFTDALRWTLDTEMAALRLEHVRHGPDEPVPLVELVADHEGGLTPLGPHLCGEDRYEGSVRLVEDAVLVTWRVTGPQKNQEIVRRYR